MKSIIRALTLSTALALTACAPNTGFNTDSDGSNDGQNLPGPTWPGDQEPPPQAGWERVDFKGYASGGTYNQNLVIYIDKANQSLLLVLPIPVIIPIIAPIPVPDLEGAELTSYTDAQGNTNLAVSIPLRHIVRGGVFMPNERLPNGDPLPYVPSGELPGFAIEFPQMRNYQIHLYVGVSVAAVFAELPDFGLPFGWIFPVKNSAGTKVVGAVGYVAPKGQYDGGMYLAAQLPPELAQIIDELIRW